MGIVVSFFVLALLLYLGARLVARVWWVLLIVAVLVLVAVIIYRVHKGKPKY